VTAAIRSYEQMRWVMAVSSFVLLLSTVVVAVFCAITVIRIEFLDHAAGGAIARKIAQEPHSKWRTGDGISRTFEEAEDRYRKENYLTNDQLLGKTAEEDGAIRQEIRDSVLASGNWKPSAHDQLGEILRSGGLWLHPLSLLVILVSYFALLFPTLRMRMSPWFWLWLAGIGTGALLVAIFRGYAGELGI